MPPTAITFPVDDVTPAGSPLPTHALAEVVGAHMALGAPARAVIETPAIHPLLAAVHVAFAEHRPLVLSPDTIWLTIAQGTALESGDGVGEGAALPGQAHGPSGGG
jgi:hypothetical protein